MKQIEYVDGVPRWFTRLHHLAARRRCRRVGHAVTYWRSCDRCGLVIMRGA